MSGRERDESLRLEIAQEAARIIAQGGRRDFAAAKRKAADRLGARQRGGLPSNREIELALVDHRRLFRDEAQDAYVAHMRECARQALELFEDFHPRLVGSLVDGTAGEGSEVTLHLFAEPAEAVGFFLDAHRIPYRLDEQRVRYADDRTARIPCYRYVVDDVPMELAVFSLAGRRQAPLSPTDARPMRRVSRRELDASDDIESGEHR